jgi:hypothetical protein
MLEVVTLEYMAQTPLLSEDAAKAYIRYAELMGSPSSPIATQKNIEKKAAMATDLSELSLHVNDVEVTNARTFVGEALRATLFFVEATCSVEYAAWLAALHVVSKLTKKMTQESYDDDDLPKLINAQDRMIERVATLEAKLFPSQALQQVAVQDTLRHRMRNFAEYYAQDFVI